MKNSNKLFFALAIVVFVFAIFAAYPAKAQAAKQVYYSVGQNTSDHKTGSPTMTISGGVATFSVPQTATNMGVGDRITYNGTSKVWISGKASADGTQWNVVTVKGTTPSNVANATVNSIAHEFSSLFEAISYYLLPPKAADADHLNTSNLVAGDYVLNIPCYYDSGPDIISGNYTKIINLASPGTGFTTGPSNYLKIYTPNNTVTEVNQSQRHEGKWNDSRYRIRYTPTDDSSSAIRSFIPYVKIDGLQFELISSKNGNAAIEFSYLTSGWIEISNNIIKGQLTNYGYGMFLGYQARNVTAKIWNNLIYDIRATGYGNSSAIHFDNCYSGTCGKAYIYNNTIVNTNDGMTSANGKIYAKNNIIQDCAATCYAAWSGGSFDSSSTNNISSDGTAPGLNYKRNTIVSFVNKTGKDFHLAAGDTKARNTGANLSSDIYLPFASDIDDNARPVGVSWDRGTDESTLNFPDLTASASTPTEATVDEPLTFEATVMNIGDAATGAGFYSFFQVATEAQGNGTLTDLVASSVGALSASGNVQVSSPSYTFTSEEGIYSVRICADKADRNDSGDIDEGNEENNCGEWTDVVVEEVIPATVGINANPLSIPYNTESTLSWSYSDALAGSCSITPPGSIGGYPSGFGSVSTGNLISSRTYTISCEPVGPNSTAEITVDVQEQLFELNIIKSGQGGAVGVSDPPQTDIDCGDICQIEYNAGTTVTLTATPSPGRIFTGWSGACSGRGDCVITIDSSKTVYANFALYRPNYQEF